MEPSRRAPEAELVGAIERVTYAHEESLYSVLRLAPDKGYGPPPERFPFRPELVTAVGRIDRPAPGMRVRLGGRWIEHKEHGTQFEFETVEVLPPAGRAGLAKYLASDRFEGIGEKLAERIVAVLGDDAFTEILEHPEKLDAVKGLRPAVRDGLVAAVALDFGAHRAQGFLRGHGLGPVQAATVVKRLGPNAEELVRQDPYRLAGTIPGIGFAIADRIAHALGLAPDDPRRARAALVHGLGEAAGDGHTLLPRAELVASASALLQDAVPVAVLEAAVDELARQAAIVVETELDGEARVYLPHLAFCERELAKNLGRLLASGARAPLADEDDLARAERQSGVALHASQRAAVLGLLARPLALLTGGPGVGKTTITRFVVQLAKAKGAKILLASPTGRAAKRLQEATGEPAQTVHRLLGYDPTTEGFVHDARNPLDADLVVVDEVSMLDLVLGHHLVKAIAAPTRLVLVGDPDQLPSVGPGNVLRDLLACERVPRWRLTEIFRQAQGSMIVVNAHRILAGLAPELPPRGDRASDFYFFAEEDPARAAELTVDVVTRRIPETFGLSWIDDVQVVAPMYRGECGVDALNERLRAALGAGGREVVQGARTWRFGDRVIHTRNDYEKEVFNGDLGRIARIDADGVVHVKYPEREVRYEGSELSDLQPAFAITVHRAQGAEFPGVVIPLVPQHWMMLQRHLLYTAITRARRLCVLVGSRRALQMAIDNADEALRRSALAGRLERTLARP
ncbi:MAG: ATP-dependent RecD-like DNA helicase [Planctomycetes bacterium]|nr:ATP-dependent RecD-like DNA helicase [Planctomycetota bacterium]